MPTLTRPYTTAAPTSFGAAGTTTGETVNGVAYAKDKGGNAVRIQGDNTTGAARLEITSTGAEAGVLGPNTDNETDQAVEVEFRLSEFSAAASAEVNLILGYTSDSAYYRVNLSHYSNFVVSAKSNNYYPLSGSPLNLAANFDRTHKVRLRARRVSISPTVIEVSAWDIESGTTLIGTTTFTDNNTGAGLGPQGAGRAGLTVAIGGDNDGGSTPGSVTAKFASLIVTNTVSAPELVPGVASVGTRTSNSVQLNAGAATGGTGALSRQWHTSPTAGFTPAGGTAVGSAQDGAATGSYSDSTISGSQIRYGRAVYVDSAGTPQSAMSVELAYTLPMTALVLPSVPTNQVRSPKVGFLGDSRTWCNGGGSTDATRGIADWFAVEVQNFLASGQTVTAINQGWDSTQTTQWLPDAGAWGPAGGLPNLLTRAFNAFDAAGGVPDIVLGLGTNDANANTHRSAANWRANLEIIIAAIQAWVFSNGSKVARIWLTEAYYTVPLLYSNGAFDEQSNALMVQYNALIPAICEAKTTSNCKVLPVGGELYRRVVDNPDGLLSDKLHPSTGTVGGRRMVGKAVAAPYLSETSTTPPPTPGEGLTDDEKQTLTDLKAMIETVNGVARFKASALAAWQSVLPVIDPNESLTWSFERVHPAPGTALPAASCERHLVRAKASRPDGTYLSASQVAAFGLEIAFYKGTETRVWKAMQPDAVRNALAQTLAANSFYFSLQVGPGSSPLVALLAGSYSVSVRIAATPHLERPLGLLTIAPPNP